MPGGGFAIATAYVDVEARLDKGSATSAATKAGQDAGSGFSKGFQSAGAKMKSVGSSMSKWVTLPLVGMGAMFASELMEADEALGQTEAAIKSTGGAAGQSVDDILAMSGSLSELSSFDDEAIQNGANTLLTFTKVAGENFEPAMLQILNLSARFGTDIQSTSIMVGKALNDPIKGLTTLGKAGITFSEEQKTAIASMVEMGDVAGAQTLILGELETQVGGSAEAYGSGLAGKLRTVKNQFLEVGASMLEGLIPAMEVGAGVATTLMGAFADLPKPLKTIVAIMASLAAAMGPVLWVGGSLATKMKDLSVAFTALKTFKAAGAISQVGTAATAAGTGIGSTVMAAASAHPIIAGLTVAALAGAAAWVLFRDEAAEASDETKELATSMGELDTATAAQVIASDKLLSGLSDYGIENATIMDALNGEAGAREDIVSSIDSQIAALEAEDLAIQRSAGAGATAATDRQIALRAEKEALEDGKSVLDDVLGSREADADATAHQAEITDELNDGLGRTERRLRDLKAAHEDLDRYLEGSSARAQWQLDLMDMRKELRGFAEDSRTSQRENAQATISINSLVSDAIEQSTTPEMALRKFNTIRENIPRSMRGILDAAVTEWDNGQEFQVEVDTHGAYVKTEAFADEHNRVRNQVGVPMRMDADDRAARTRVRQVRDYTESQWNRYNPRATLDADDGPARRKLAEITRLAHLFDISTYTARLAVEASGSDQHLLSLVPRAGGGPVMANQPYVVGERRPELFVPETNGTILPHVPKANAGGGNTTAMGGGGNIYINTIEIPAKDLAEMRDVADFFNRIEQTARTGGTTAIAGRR